MYAIMFAAGIYLRYKRPDVPRAYKIPGGKGGMWLTAGVGFLSSISAIVIGFFPPHQLETGSPRFYVLFLVFGMLLFCAAPFIILLFKKPSWNEPIRVQDKH